MRNRLPIVAMLFVAALASADTTNEPGPTWIDARQATALQSSAVLHCLRIHQDHRAGRSPDDCVMIDHRTMEARVAPPGAEESWPLHLASIWCEGNRYGSKENRFQIRGEQTCDQVCERSEEDRTCITKADIGRAARREPHAWKVVGEFRLVERPRKRVPRCAGDEEHAEAWRVVMLDLRAAPGIERTPSIPFRDDRPILVQVVCPDGVEIQKGARFRALAANGDTCLPWYGEDFAPCLHRPEPVEAPPDER